jgi:hypothetical protein
MLAIADSRVQPELLRAAKDAGKIARNYEIPATARDNTPERIAVALKPLALPAFPFGTDFTPVEQRLLFALERLQKASPAGLAQHALRGALRSPSDPEALARMGLAAPRGLTEHLYRSLLKSVL